MERNRHSILVFAAVCLWQVNCVAQVQTPARSTSETPPANVSALPSAAVAQSSSGKINFSREILPILSENCFYCHGPDRNRRKAKLRLDDETDAKKDRDDGAVIVAGNSTKSLIMQKILAKDPDDRMPPPASNKHLSSKQIALIKQWIDEGAVWGKHWAFAEINSPEIPNIKDRPNRNPIDAFVVANLQREKLVPSPRADKTTLIRRVTLDLTGLPPTLEEVAAFLADDSPNAYERVVERLLKSPAYGERMAWDWMEVARYADSNGYQGDAERTMWPWRDWVVKAFNTNMPYDEFTIWQLAGDLLPNATDEQKLATGFCRNHPINGEGGRIAEENRVDYVMDMTETTATVWLGLTFTCTRCHDHKFDPLTRRDYYGMFALFNQTPVTGEGGDAQSKPNLDCSTPEQKEKLAELEKSVHSATLEVETLEKSLFGPATITNSNAAAASEEEIPQKDAKEILRKPVAKRNKLSLETLEKEFGKSHTNYVGRVALLRHALEARESYTRQIPRVMIMRDRPELRKTFILEKGIYNKPGDEVGPTLPNILAREGSPPPINRLDLARWLVSRENPLTARVTVNRIWQMFFGIGLVKTSEDFGVQGEFPANPDLFDYLASTFRDSGWDVKRLIRLLVTSDTYCQSSKVSKELLERDPNNRLLARGPRFRMPSWMIRDQALAASGLLAGKIGGPPVKPYQPAGVWEETTFGKKTYEQDHGDALYRRSLYIFWRRIVGPTELFDTASRMTCSVKPARNNSPLHALTLLNDTTYIEAARKLAERVMIQTQRPEKRAELAFQSVVVRKPTRDELKLLLAEVDRAKTQFADKRDDAKALLAIGESANTGGLAPVEQAAWTATCLAILNLDEAMTKE